MDGVERQFQPVGNAQLVEDVVQMVLHRLLADEHLLGHFLVLEALRHQRHDLPFALAERRTLAFAAERPAAARAAHLVGGHELPDHGRGGVRIQPDFAGVHFADALDQQFRGGLLQHDAGRAQLHGLDEFVLVVRRGQAR